MKRCLLLIMILALTSAPCLAGPEKGVSGGNLLYNEKKYDEAIEEYSKALSSKANADIAHFNMGDALYRKSEFGKATESYTKTLGISEDPRLEAKTNYNIGNSLYRSGQSKEKKDKKNSIAAYTKALGHYRRAMELDPDDHDAKFNYEFVSKKIEELSQQQDQSPDASRQSPEKEQEKKEEKEQDEKQSPDAGRQSPEKEKEQKEQEKKEQEGQKDESQGEEQEEKDEQQGEEGQQGEQQEEGQEEEGQGGLSFYQEETEPKEMSSEEAGMLLDSLQGEEEAARRNIRAIRRRKAHQKTTWNDW
ncbi:MAG: tetratricopeptide repeat protein [Candidatus Omnitrophota bacterium]